RKRQSAVTRQVVREDPFEPCTGARTRDLVLGKARDLGEAHRVAHGAAFVADRLVRVRAVIRDVLARFGALRREPQRVLEPEGGAKDRAFRAQAVVYWRHPQRPRSGELLVRKADAEAPRVVL